jgi:hypothetical protein
MSDKILNNENYTELTSIEKKMLNQYVKSNYTKLPPAYSVETDMQRFNNNTKKLLVHLQKVNNFPDKLSAKDYVKATIFLGIYSLCTISLLILFVFYFHAPAHP